MALLDSMVDLGALRRSILAAAGATALLTAGCTDRAVDSDSFGDDGDGTDGGSTSGGDDGGDDGADDGATTASSADGDGGSDDGTPPPVGPTCAPDENLWGDVLLCTDDVANCGLCLDDCFNQAAAILEQQGEWACGGWQLDGVNCSEVIGDQCCQVVQLYDIGCAGRPFEVAGEARFAAPTERGDWAADLSPAYASSLTPSMRRTLADYWRAVGLAEHASIASFARFTLDLMMMGAPASLLRGSQRATADEIEHARLAFALSSAYAGVSVGPGPFDPGAMEARDAVTIVVAAVIEGCVEETLSAALASVAAAQTADATVANVLRKIARDEERHAALAWSFVRWAAETQPELRDTIEAAFIGAIAAAAEGARDTTDRDDGLAAHGMLSAHARRATVRAALRDIIDPARRVLVAA